MGSKTKFSAFGLSAKDFGHFADILAAASTNANTNVSMLGESFKYAAPVAGSLGISAEDTSVALGLMANAGIKASQAGTSLRTGLNVICRKIIYFSGWSFLNMNRVKPVRRLSEIS
jgi:TP901 family phage tail tape measure protein